MTTNIKNCPIWGTPLEGATIQLIDSQNGITWNGYDSPRAGGSYRVATDAAIGELSAEEKARLTTWLVDQRLQGEPITRDNRDHNQIHQDEKVSSGSRAGRPTPSIHRSTIPNRLKSSFDRRG